MSDVELLRSALAAIATGLDENNPCWHIAEEALAMTRHLASGKRLDIDSRGPESWEIYKEIYNGR